jgi:cytochrome c oxidase cbb3-type subunit 2
LLFVLIFFVTGCNRPSPESQVIGNYTPNTVMTAEPRLVDLGKQVFDKQCAPCHGVNGDGQGPAAYLLFPKPRNFVKGQFRLVSTWDVTPTDDDFFKTISRGMPGSAMPSWAHLTEETRWGLVHYIKTLIKNPIQIRPDHQPQNINDAPAGRIALTPEPPYTTEAKIRAQELFAKGCAPCHGATGKGDGKQEQIDSDGLPTRPRDLTAGVYKGSSEPAEVYKRILAGLPGTPMPSNSYLYGNDAWHLVHFVREMSSEQQRARMEMKRFRIVAKRVDRLPDHPDDSAWRSTPAVELHLMPLWWRDARPEVVSVQALHNGNDIAVQLIWADSTYDHTAVRPQDFRDAAALEFALTPDPPFFGMGEGVHGATVNIWMWKGERQADLEPAFQEIDKVYPNIGIDSYPNLQRSPLEQPTRNALTLDSDPTFVTGWGAKNIVSDPTRKSPAEDLYAAGFGTLRARPMTDQLVNAAGVYSIGSYRVLLRRSLQARGENSVALRPGTTWPVSFAIWDGSAGDRDGKKSVTIWQDLYIEP